MNGASDLQEMEKDGEVIIKALTLFLKGSPPEMDAWLKQSFDLSPCFLEDGCDKRSHLKRLGKEVIKGCVSCWKRCHRSCLTAAAPSHLKATQLLSS